MADFDLAGLVAAALANRGPDHGMTPTQVPTPAPPIDPAVALAKAFERLQPQAQAVAGQQLRAAVGDVLTGGTPPAPPPPGPPLLPPMYQRMLELRGLAVAPPQVPATLF